MRNFFQKYKEDIFQFVCGIFIISCFVLFITLMVGLCNYGGHIQGVEFMQKEAVKRGYGEYNKSTGKWQWKENPCQVDL